MSRLPLVAGAVLLLGGVLVAALLTGDPTPEETGAAAPRDAEAQRALRPTPGRIERRRVDAPARPRTDPAAKVLWADLRRALRDDRPLDALRLLEQLRAEHPDAVSEDAAIVAEIETRVLDVLAVATRAEALELLPGLRDALRLDASRRRLGEIVAALAGGLSHEEAQVVAAGRDVPERETLTRHLHRFGPELPGVDRGVARPNWVDGTLDRVKQRIERRKTPREHLPVADAEAAETRRLEQLDKLREREAVHLLDHIHAGLAWLALHQHEDGYIDDETAKARCAELGHDPVCIEAVKSGARRHRRAATALMALAFLDFRDQDARALFEPSLSAAVGWLRGRQKGDGSFGGVGYESAIVMMALGQAASSSGDEELVRELERAWTVTMGQRGPLGGYRYSTGQAGDLSVTGWYVQAYEASVAAGVEVPKDLAPAMQRFVAYVWDGDSAYGYTNPARRDSLRSVGMLSQHILDAVRDEALLDRWSEVLLAAETDTSRRLNLYQLYYDVRMELLLDGTLSESRRDAVTALARDWQVQDGDAAGSFGVEAQVEVGGKKTKKRTVRTRWIGRSGGPVVMTAFSVLTLEHALYRR